MNNNNNSFISTISKTNAHKQWQIKERKKRERRKGKEEAQGRAGQGTNNGEQAKGVGIRKGKDLSPRLQQ